MAVTGLAGKCSSRQARQGLATSWSSHDLRRIVRKGRYCRAGSESSRPITGFYSAHRLALSLAASCQPLRVARQRRAEEPLVLASEVCGVAVAHTAAGACDVVVLTIIERRRHRNAYVRVRYPYGGHERG